MTARNHSTLVGYEDSATTLMNVEADLPMREQTLIRLRIADPSAILFGVAGGLMVSLSAVCFCLDNRGEYGRRAGFASIQAYICG